MSRDRAVHTDDVHAGREARRERPAHLAGRQHPVVEPDNRPSKRVEDVATTAKTIPDFVGLWGGMLA